MRAQAFPILEFDADGTAVIEPRSNHSPLLEMPRHAVLCFVRDALERYVARHSPPLLHSIRTEMGPLPVYRADLGGRPVALASAGVGAPLAAGTLEVLIALGARRFVACGGAGVLDPEIALGDLVVPTAALRDEGTSYHYVPAAREVAASADALNGIAAALARRGLAFHLARTWTTDAFFRETRAKVAARRAEGCRVVEMECAALFAVGQFRGVPVGGLLYGGDDVSGERWVHRNWEKQHDLRDRLVRLAMESCLEMT